MSDAGILNLVLCYEQLGQTARAEALRQELDASVEAR